MLVNLCSIIGPDCEGKSRDQKGYWYEANSVCVFSVSMGAAHSVCLAFFQQNGKRETAGV
ncbi:MAG: hypothetical protein WAM95_03615 [Bacillus sp. (in: firmicutes)]